MCNHAIHHKLLPQKRSDWDSNLRFPHMMGESLKHLDHHDTYGQLCLIQGLYTIN